MNIQNVCSSRLTTGCIAGSQVYTDFKAAVRPVLNRRIAIGLVLYASTLATLGGICYRPYRITYKMWPIATDAV